MANNKEVFLEETVLRSRDGSVNVPVKLGKQVFFRDSNEYDCPIQKQNHERAKERASRVLGDGPYTISKIFISNHYNLRRTHLEIEGQLKFPKDCFEGYN